MKIGILGGGQLARMMALRGAELGLAVYILSENKNDPAAQVTQNWVAGSVDDTVSVQRFFSNVDVVTFESEFINTKKLESKLNSQLIKKVRPNIECISLLQERASQKNQLLEYKIPTSPFIMAPDQFQLIDFFKKCKNGIVCKKRTHGYDGYGTFLIKSISDLNHFIAQNSKTGAFVGTEYIAEELLIFKKELALSAVRDVNGHILWTPLVEWKARDKKCWWVKGPVRHPNIQKLKRSLNTLLQSLNYIGFISFEIFETKKGLIINEVAPRVHNSAHYSLNALSRDQFQLHLLACSGLSLKKIGPHNSTLPTLTKSFAMVNLTGQETAETKTPPHISTPGFLHWYSKDSEKPGRKMGHINVCGVQSAELTLKKALQLEKEFFNEYKKK